MNYELEKKLQDSKISMEEFKIEITKENYENVFDDLTKINAISREERYDKTVEFLFKILNKYNIKLPDNTKIEVDAKSREGDTGQHNAGGYKGLFTFDRGFTRNIYLKHKYFLAVPSIYLNSTPNEYENEVLFHACYLIILSNIHPDYEESKKIYREHRAKHGNGIFYDKANELLYSIKPSLKQQIET